MGNQVPFWLLSFDKHGNSEDAGAIDRLIAGLESEGPEVLRRHLRDGAAAVLETAAAAPPG